MRRRIPLLVLLLSVIILAGIPLSIAQANRVALLQVFDVQPSSNAPLALNDTVVFYFNRRIDCASAEAALSWMPSIPGELTCDEYTLSFTPAGEYERDTAYTFALTPPLHALDGARLDDPFRVTYKTAGFLTVTETFPSAEGGPVPADSAITVVFDRPVVPLMSSTNRDALPNPLRLLPSTEGNGEWVNSAVYTFTPASSLHSGISYRATVAADLEALDGAVMGSSFSWIFQTAVASVLSIDPPLGTAGLSLDPKIQVRFNQVMEQSAVERGFYFRALPAIAGADVSGRFEWAEDGRGFVFTPDTLLQLDSTFEAGFSPDLNPNLNFSNLPGSGSWRYDTVPAPDIQSTEPLDGALNVDRGGLSLFFASTMNIDTLAERIQIEPEPEAPPRYYFSDWSNRYTVSFDAQPSTKYTIRIALGMEDIYGNAIADPLIFSYITGPRTPMLGLNVPGPVGFYNAYRNPTQLYAYHRGADIIDFALSRVPIADFIERLTQEDFYDPAHTFDPKDDQLLKRWRVESETPENITRYELLELGDVSTANGNDCIGAPFPHLSVGDIAKVIAEPDPLRARRAPVGGVIMELLYYGYELTVVGGPRCIDELRWWQVALQDGRTAWVAEGDSEEYFLERRDAEGLEPGVYFLEATAPGLEHNYSQNRHFLNVSTAVLTVKQATDRLTVWAVDVDSGAPIASEGISIYGPGGVLLGSGTSDGRGIVQVDIPYTRDLYTPFVAVLDSTAHFGIGFTDWTNGTGPWNYGYNFSWSPRAYQAYLYTDRPVYRTGQPLYFRGIVRSKDDVVYMPAPVESVTATIRDARGEIVYERELALNDFGSFSGSFDIAAEASLGAYSLSLELPSEEEYLREGSSISFLVAEYRLPEYQVTLSAEQPEIAQGAMATFALEGNYFFGGPVSDAEANYTVFSSPYDFNYKGDEPYDFADYDIYDSVQDRFGVDSVISEGSLTTDATGKARFDLVGDLQGEKRSQQWRVEASIRDEADQTIYGSSILTVHQGLFYVGLRAENAVSRAGEDSRIRIIAVDWNSQPMAEQLIDVQVIERRWTSVQEQDPNTGATAWTWDVEEIPVTNGSVTTDADGNADFVYQPPNGGVFKIIATARDTAGNLVRTATYSWISSPSYVSWRQENDRTLELVPDKRNYSVGVTAKILIASPFQGAAEALISIERGDVLSVEQVTLSSNSQIHEFEILPQHAPNIYVSVFLIKPVDENNAIASWRLGMTQLAVDIEQKELNIDITADRDIAAPQENVRYRVRVTDYKGDPVVAEVGIGVTDLAALSVAERNSASMLETFYGPQELSVRTSSSLVVNADAATADLSERKGGGGGIFESGIVDLRGEFIDTAFWNPTVVTDAAGEAAVDVRLPDNLTTWRLDARALTEGRAGRLLVGETSFDLLSTRPLLIRPVTPRFFIVGDQVQLAAVVNNNTGKDIAARVSIEKTAGLDVADDKALLQNVMIPAGGRKRVTWQVTVTDVTSIAPYFVVRSNDGDYADASISPVSADRDGTLPVYRYHVPETVGTAGTLTENGSRVEAVLLRRDQDLKTGTLDIRINKSLAGVISESLTYMEAETLRFRECTTTIVSRFLPNIVSFRALTELGMPESELKATLDALVSEGLQELYARQLANGGWSWCSYPEGDELTTAYALIGLAEAKRQGYLVDSGLMRRAQRFLVQRLITPSLKLEQWKLNRQAFILYALAESGAADVARSTTLFESRERLNLDAIAFLAQTLHIVNPDDRMRLDSLTQLMLNRAVTRATGTFFAETYQDRWNWSSDIRSTALVLNTLIKLRPESDLLPNIVRRLVSVREGKGYWQSRQENTWAIIALTNWMLQSGELDPDFVFSVAVNGRELLRDAALPDNVSDADAISVDVADLIQRESNLIEFERDAGNGALYYTARLNLDLPVNEVEPISRGIEISRSYTLLGDESRTAIEGATVGDAVQVRLRIVAPDTLRYVVIEDFLPSGAEAINPDLAISPQLGTIPSSERIDPQAKGWGWWFFDYIEFRDEKVIIYASYLPRGIYEYVYTISPSIAGQFNVIPPIAQELYFPEVYGRGAGTRFTITD